MSKNLRLHTGGSDDIQDWTRVGGFLDSTQIESIKDPAGASAKRQITSIPSPFARIDLVKTAFRQVAAGSPEGTSIYHKMVSDALDVGQIFFNAAKLTDKVEVISWNPGLRWVNGAMEVDDDSDLGRLIKSDSEGHQLYGETLKIFFSQDSAAYNFDKLNQIYLLNYKDGKGQLDIIGGTSPATLFFSSANKLDYIKDIRFGQDIVFDDIYCPLYRRSEDYILFLYSLRNHIPRFSNLFKEVADYLDACLEALPAALRSKVRALTPDQYRSDFAGIPLAGTGNHPEILDTELRGVKVDAGQPEVLSDFTIEATQPFAGRRPLVLPAYTFNSKLRYVDDYWSPKDKAPYHDARPPEERTLPGQLHRYPYLTVSDFLAPYIIQLPFEPNADKFFTGHLPAGGNGFLLPLTDRFFEYFSTEDLQHPGADGSPMIRLSPLPAGAVKATLRIPIKGGRTIEMERVYYASVNPASPVQPDIAANRGAISLQQLSVAIYPFVKRGTDDGASYTVMMIDRGVSGAGLRQSYKLQFYKNGAAAQPLTVTAVKQKSEKTEHLVGTAYHVVDREFDYIRLDNGVTQGYLVPLMPLRSSGAQQFSFAIDFGTTNTHIEYSIDGGPPQAFEMGAADSQLGMLHRADNETYNHLLDSKYGLGATLLIESVGQEFLPEQIGRGSENRFPQRTVVSEPMRLDIHQRTYPLADFSVYWKYERIIRPAQLRYHTNLKWSNISGARRDDEVKRITGYLQNLVLLVRNKVLLNGGDLRRTKIVWFYPSSMSSNRKGTFEEIWTKAIEKYIGSGIEQVSLPESVAPFYHYKAAGGVTAGNKPVINIDIGGGTTDVVVYQNSAVSAFTSFKYAANSLFGDGYGNSPGNNGYVQFFEKHYKGLIDQTILGSIYNELLQKGKSDDIVSFLFGLESNPERKSLDFSFNQKLRETSDLKIAPLLFFASIIYHVAKYQKARGGEVPRYITFSGTGSKILHILDASRQLSGLKRLVNEIFSEVYEMAGADIDIVMAPGPKEMTAKGGLLAAKAPAMAKSVLAGLHSSSSSISPVSLNDAATQTVQTDVLEEVRHFIDLFFALDKKINYSNEFGVSTSSFEQYKQVLLRDLDVFLQEGLEEKRAEMSGQTSSPIDETLFFLPLIGSLNRLASYIIDQA